MSVQRISIDTPDIAASVVGSLDLKANDAMSLNSLGRYFQSIAGGARTAKVRANVGAVQAAGTIAFSSFADADTVTINGIVLTGKTTPSGASQWAVGADDQACANNLVAKINASALDKIVGVASASRRATLLLSSFATADTVTLNGIVFTGKTTPSADSPREFAIGGTDALTAENLKVCMERAILAGCIGTAGLAGITITRSSATLTINAPGTLTLSVSAHGTATSKTVVVTSIVGGQIGNLMTLAISAHGSKVDPAGGTEGTEYIFAQNYTAP